MAGQPPEPSFQPAGQDESLTQGRPAWQPAAYPPPPAPGAGQPGYSAPSYTPPGQGYTPADQGYTPADQGYPPPDQGYQGQEQTYTSVPQGQAQAQAQPQSGDYQGYQGYQPPSYGAQPGQQQDQRTPPPQWQGIAGVTPAPAKQPKERGEHGFIGSLFDFSFSTFVTPKIIKVLYILVTIWTALLALTILVVGFRTGGIWGGLFTLFIIEPIFILLTLGVYRVVLEAFMVVFRIYEETKQIRENSAKQS
ncbi:MAG TPA: DUF4282 domain-containing protein [Trebonia sp.]|jgi:hypothetical protein|nr:DUF4282 domain-containing protein [Trebonia sp.]